MSDNSKIYIKNKDIWSGIRCSLKYGQTLMEHSDLLYRNAKYQSSIPLAHLSFEEASKCAQLCKLFDSKKNITEKYWKKMLINHDKKSKYFLEAILSLQSLSHKDNVVTNSNQIRTVSYRKYFEKFQKYVDNFNKLKFLCFYSDWDPIKKEWVGFENIIDKKHLAYFVITSCKIFLYLSMYDVDNLLWLNPTIKPDITQCSRCNKICMNNTKCGKCHIVQFSKEINNEYMDKGEVAITEFLAK